MCGERIGQRKSEGGWNAGRRAVARAGGGGRRAIAMNAGRRRPAAGDTAEQSAGRKP